MDVRMCNQCGSRIPSQRLEALPETRSCVKCSCVSCRSVHEVDLGGPSNEDLVKATHDVACGD